MKTDNQEMERAVEITAHNIAGCIHIALARKRMTVRELKERITDWDPELVDSVLLGVQPELIRTRMLADLAYILGFDWQFSVSLLPTKEEVKAAA